MKLGTKVALKEKRPKLDHRCKGFVTELLAEDELMFWCLKCRAPRWAEKRDVVRVVPKPVGWTLFYKDGSFSRNFMEKFPTAFMAQQTPSITSGEIAPVYLGRKRRVK